MIVTRELVTTILTTISDLSRRNTPATRSKILQTRALSSRFCSSDKEDYEEFKHILSRLIAEGFVRHEVRKVSGIDRDTYCLTTRGSEAINFGGMSYAESEQRAAVRTAPSIPASHRVEEAATSPPPCATLAQPADATAVLLAKLVDTVADLSRAVNGLRGQIMQKTVTDAETIGCLRAEVKHLRSKLAYLRLPGLN